MRRTWLLFSQAVTVVVAVMFVVGTLKPEWMPQRADGADRSDGTRPRRRSSHRRRRRSSRCRSSAASSRRATAPPPSAHAPAVVSITASRAPARNPRTDDPMFRFFFGDRGRQIQEERQVGLGSGVIVSTSGYLITNNHVIEGADDIEVALSDGRSAKAKVIGTDPDSDVAVLKIELDRLPAVSFGNVDTAQVGDIVLAIGNPFGVGQTVTSGIVSALGRSQLGINTFENFIQTDAAINPGNSGGALVDANGNLLGINTAIYSRSGGSMGIGFAIPVSTARQVMESLIKEGRVIRGWIGVEPRDLTPEIAQTLNLPIKQGVLITGVLQNGPAGAGGMRPGDVVVKIAGTPVVNTVQLLNAVAALKPQAPADIAVQRGDKQVDLTVTVAQRPLAKRPVER